MMKIILRPFADYEIKKTKIYDDQNRIELVQDPKTELFALRSITQNKENWFLIPNEWGKILSETLENIELTERINEVIADLQAFVAANDPWNDIADYNRVQKWLAGSSTICQTDHYCDNEAVEFTITVLQSILDLKGC